MHFGEINTSEDELKIWKEVALVYFKALPFNMSGDSDENNFELDCLCYKN
jgi:hypothetical protein